VRSPWKDADGNLELIGKYCINILEYKCSRDAESTQLKASHSGADVPSCWLVQPTALGFEQGELDI
jgi:hypothetical protein